MHSDLLLQWGHFYKIKMCYCCSWDSPGFAVDLISESIGYLCALWFLGGLAVAGFRAYHGNRGPVFYCHIMTTVFLVV